MESDRVKELIHDYIKDNMFFDLKTSTNGFPQEGGWSTTYKITLSLRNPISDQVDEIGSIDIEVPSD
jgi:hypothetical protein